MNATTNRTNDLPARTRVLNTDDEYGQKLVKISRAPHLKPRRDDKKRRAIQRVPRLQHHT